MCIREEQAPHIRYARQTCPNITTPHIQGMSHIFEINYGICGVHIFKIMITICDGYHNMRRCYIRSLSGMSAVTWSCCAEQQPFIFYRNTHANYLCKRVCSKHCLVSPSHLSIPQTYLGTGRRRRVTATSGVPEGLVTRFALCLWETRLLTVYSTFPACSRWAYLQDRR
jgi:hypothetical protein